MNILAQYLYSFTLLFLVQQLACFKCQAQRILTSIQNVCDVVEPSEDHTTSTSINIGDTLSTTQSTCVKNFKITVDSSTYVKKYLIFEVFFQDLTADLRLRPLLLEKSASLPTLLVNTTSGSVYYDSDTEDLNGFVNRKSYQNIVIEPSNVTLNKVFYFSLYYYTDDTDHYFSATNTYEIKVRSTSEYPCPNDCSGENGTCSQSLKKCICKTSHFDLDCSVTATKISYEDFQQITIEAQQSQLFYTTIQGPVQNLKVYFNKTVGNVDLLFRINPKNYFDLPNLDGILGEDQLSYSLESTYIIFPYEFLKNYFGNSLLINAFNTNSDSVIVKTMAEIYDEGVANRETLMIIMIGVSGFFIIMWAIITITKYKILRDLGALLQPENDRNEERRQVLSTEDMDRYFPKKKFKEHVFSFAQNTCSICLEDFQPDSLCRQLYCEHIYHGKCIEDWLAQHESCPNCKKSMLKADIEEFLSAPKNEQILLSAEAQESGQDSGHPFKRSGGGGLEVQEEEKQNNENSLHNINIRIKEYRTEKKDQYGLEESEARRNFRDKRSQSNSKYQSKLNLMEPKKSNSQRDIDGRKLSNTGASQLIDLDVEEHELAGKLSSSSINLENRLASRKSRSVSEKNPLQKYKSTPDNQSPIKGDDL